MPPRPMRFSRLCRRAPLIGLAGALLVGFAALTGCANMTPHPKPAAHVVSRPPAPTPDEAAALTLAQSIQSMARLVQSPPAQQMQMLAAARAAYEDDPGGEAQLRYALLLAAPGSGQDPGMAQNLLMALYTQPASLTAAEQAVVVVELGQLDALIKSQNYGKGRADANADAEARVSSLQDKLDKMTADNVQLRKLLAEARAKLQAVANIERNLTEQKPAEGPKK